MAKLFTVASWNVEHFKNNPRRIQLIVDFLKAQNPDVFGLYEVESREVYDTLVQRMPQYHFHITEGPQTQEILVAAKRTLTAFFTQKTEFKRGNTYLRPGALLTLRFGTRNYPILFLHTKSGTEPIGLGLRDDMFARGFKFKKTLDKVAGGSGKSDYMFLGDLNTMGMTYPFKREIQVEYELKKLDREAAKVGMRRLTKTSEGTWWNGTASLPPSNLDHVIASRQLRFRPFGGKDIDVRGWPMLAMEDAKRAWIRRYSDHGLLFFQVEA